MYWDHMNGWGWATMSLWSLLWVAALVALVWAGLRWSRGGGAGSPPEHAKTARELLDERLAAGEIDVDEYARRRAALEGRDPTAAAR